MISEKTFWSVIGLLVILCGSIITGIIQFTRAQSDIAEVSATVEDLQPRMRSVENQVAVIQERITNIDDNVMRIDKNVERVLKNQGVTP